LQVISLLFSCKKMKFCAVLDKYKCSVNEHPIAINCVQRVLFGQSYMAM
jgi:hypothetical protein